MDIDEDFDPLDVSFEYDPLGHSTVEQTNQENLNVGDDNEDDVVMLDKNNSQRDGNVNRQLSTLSNNYLNMSLKEEITAKKFTNQRNSIRQRTYKTIDSKTKIVFDSIEKNGFYCETMMHKAKVKKNLVNNYQGIVTVKKVKLPKRTNIPKVDASSKKTVGRKRKVDHLLVYRASQDEVEKVVKSYWNDIDKLLRAIHREKVKRIKYQRQSKQLQRKVTFYKNAYEVAQKQLVELEKSFKLSDELIYKITLACGSYRGTRKMIGVFNEVLLMNKKAEMSLKCCSPTNVARIMKRMTKEKSDTLWRKLDNHYVHLYQDISNKKGHYASMLIGIPVKKPNKNHCIKEFKKKTVRYFQLPMKLVKKKTGTELNIIFQRNKEESQSQRCYVIVLIGDGGGENRGMKHELDRCQPIDCLFGLCTAHSANNAGKGAFSSCCSTIRIGGRVSDAQSNVRVVFFEDLSKICSFFNKWIKILLGYFQTSFIRYVTVRFIVQWIGSMKLLRLYQKILESPQALEFLNAKQNFVNTILPKMQDASFQTEWLVAVLCGYFLFNPTYYLSTKFDGVNAPIIGIQIKRIIIFCYVIKIRNNFPKAMYEKFYSENPDCYRIPFSPEVRNKIKEIANTYIEKLIHYFNAYLLDANFQLSTLFDKKYAAKLWNFFVEKKKMFDPNPIPNFYGIHYDETLQSQWKEWATTNDPSKSKLSKFHLLYRWYVKIFCFNTTQLKSENSFVHLGNLTKFKPRAKEECLYTFIYPKMTSFKEEDTIFSFQQEDGLFKRMCPEDWGWRQDQNAAKNSSMSSTSSGRRSNSNNQTTNNRVQEKRVSRSERSKYEQFIVTETENEMRTELEFQANGFVGVPHNNIFNLVRMMPFRDSRNPKNGS